MKQILIIALLLILVLGNKQDYRQEERESRHSHRHGGHSGFFWVFIIGAAALGGLGVRKLIRRRRQLRRKRQQLLQDAVVMGQPMTPDLEQPKYYAVPVEQYQQFQAWLKQQQQQLQQQQQQQQQIQQIQYSLPVVYPQLSQSIQLPNIRVGQ